MFEKQFFTVVRYYTNEKVMYRNLIIQSHDDRDLESQRKLRLPFSFNMDFTQPLWKVSFLE